MEIHSPPGSRREPAHTQHRPEPPEPRTCSARAPLPGAAAGAVKGPPETPAAEQSRTPPPHPDPRGAGGTGPAAAGAAPAPRLRSPGKLGAGPGSRGQGVAAVSAI